MIDAKPRSSLLPCAARYLLLALVGTQFLVSGAASAILITLETAQVLFRLWQIFSGEARLEAAVTHSLDSAFAFGIVALFSYVIMTRLFRPSQPDRDQTTVIRAAVITVALAVWPVLGITLIGNTSLGAYQLYGIPLLLNLIVLACLAIRPLHDFLFRPTTAPDSGE